MGALGAFALLYDGEGRILLCHRRDADVWNLPGGQVERGETPWQAAIRETHEETGLEASVRRLTFVDHRPERDELVFTFACEGIWSRADAERGGGPARVVRTF